MTGCEQHVTAAAYVLGALADPEASEFEAHLAECETCTVEVRRLRIVADTLPLAADPVAPPAALKSRIMAVVESEADLLRAAGVAADRPEPVRRDRRGRAASGLRLRPLAASGLAVALLGAGIGIGTLAQDDGGGTTTRIVRASVAASGASAELERTGDRARLRLSNFPRPPAGRVYQVWLVREASGSPAPTSALFTVRRDGSASVDVPGDLSGVRSILVSAEPDGGSAVPTRSPVLRVSAS